MKLADTNYGALYYENGELLNKAHVGDPTAYRGGAPTGQSLVKFSGDRIRPDGVHEECVLLQFKEDERFPGSKAGSITVHLRRPHADGDAAMVHVATLNHDSAVLHVPVNGVSTAQGRVSEMWSPDGGYVTVQQGDGNFVTYHVKGNDWTPVWSAWHGFIGRHQGV